MNFEGTESTGRSAVNYESQVLLAVIVHSTMKVYEDNVFSYQKISWISFPLYNNG